MLITLLHIFTERQESPSNLECYLTGRNLEIFPTRKIPFLFVDKYWATPDQPTNYLTTN